MDQEWSVPGWAVLATLAVSAVLVTGLVVAVLRLRARATAALETAQVQVAVLKAQAERIERIERALAEPRRRADDTEYVVTTLGQVDGADEHDEREAAPVVPASLFVDLVVREGVVQAASWAAGLRRALAPEMRHRIRWEMKREVKRARKQRRDDLRRAKRELEARQRGDAGAAA
ncbi:hypothetical protein [Nocardioides rubriscoriae]|uniref:hypothetical protein n=1 Tax=Nocardioides rubriscoriae TaxID=642762 RepID=UPI0011DF3923|nr:hypothetical protein [Nocardioides rubriscoriae]